MADPPTTGSGRSSNGLCELLEIERPVLLAPMAKVAGGALAAAVSRAGGLGIVGGGYGDAGWLDEQMALVGEERVGIGVITWKMAPDGLDAILSHRPAAVWLAFGELARHIAPIRDAGAVVICQVATVDEASEAIDAGAQVIVAQGTESGGHGRPKAALLDVVGAMSRAFPEIPLVAAGGINDQVDFEAARAAGAAGVALGTAFYATDEALDLDAAKQRLIDSSGAETVRSRVYDHVRGPVWPPGYDGRTIRTRLTDEWAGREDDLASNVAEAQAAHVEAAATGDMSVRVVWAGEGVGEITSIAPAAEVVRRFRIPEAEPSGSDHD